MLLTLIILLLLFGGSTTYGFYLAYRITSRRPQMAISDPNYILLCIVSTIAGFAGLFFANFIVLFFFLIFGVDTGLGEGITLTTFYLGCRSINIVPMLSMSEVFAIPKVLSLLLISIVIIAFAEELLRIMPFLAAKVHPQVFQKKGSTLALVLSISSILLTSLWFGFLHLHNLAYFLIATVAGVILSIQITVTDNISSVVFTHGLYDFFLFSIALSLI